LANKGSRYTEGVAETSLTICRLFDYLLTIPVNCILVHNNRFFILNEVTISVIVYPPFFLTGKLFT
jgi:hypothetical protein